VDIEFTKVMNRLAVLLTGFASRADGAIGDGGSAAHSRFVLGVQ
jgi:hypothetical protein